MSDVPEARGPRLPDAIARVPGPVWPFLALTVLAAYGRWQDLSGLSFGSPVNDVALVAGSVPPIVSPLLGVALFARHPTAHRTMPSVAFGVALFAVLTVVDRLREPILAIDRQPRSDVRDPRDRHSWATAWSRRSSASSR